MTNHDILWHWDVRKQVDITILDFSKAFDIVPPLKGCLVNCNITVFVAKEFLTPSQSCVMQLDQAASM